MSIKFTFLLLLLIPNFLQVNAQTYWTGAMDSLWHNPANWNPQVVPDSQTRTIIRPDLGNPQPHWPHLNQNTVAGRVLCENAAIYFNGNSMYCFSFSTISSSITGGNDTSSIILYNSRDSSKSITITNSQFHDDFKIKTHFNSQVNFRGVIADGMLFTSGDAVNAFITIEDSSVFSENLAFEYEDFHEPRVFPYSVRLRSAIIHGDLVIQSNGGWISILALCSELIPIREY